MKVLILTNYANGLYLFRKELLFTMLEKGIQVIVSVPPDENCDKLTQIGCEVIETKLQRRGNNPIQDMKLFFSYQRILQKKKPDVVLTYTIKPNLYGGLACRIAHIPYLCNITGLGTALESGGALAGFLLAFYRIALKDAACVFFQNDTNRQFMQQQRIACGNYRLLPGSGVNLVEHPFVTYPSEQEGIRFLAVIRIMKDKGIEEYLKAAEIIHKEYLNVSFYLVGEYEPETQAYYEPWIRKLTDMDVITYLGHIDNVAEVMSENHILVHPSYHEGLSNVLLEAAACGRPVLATDVAGCRETLQDGLSGLAFAPQSVDSLVHAIKNILSYTEADRREMGIRGREYVENTFDRNIVIRTYFEEMERITGQDMI